MGEPFTIPTEYNGIRFRSRLEATWAAFFDYLGCDWRYEARDLAGYIPDFILAEQPDFETLWRPPETLVEVKPGGSLEELRAATEKIDRSGWVETACVVGLEPFWRTPDVEIPPQSALGIALRRHKHKEEYPPIFGLVRTISAEPVDLQHDLVYRRARVWQPGVLVRCCLCSYAKVVPEAAMLQMPAPCEAIEADGLPCGGSMVPPYPCLMADDWARAKNTTQWRPPA